ncbi:hypothetical protein ACJ41O_005957 [Fusarium nematophilum]
MCGDQTMRSPQRWHILAPKREQIIKLPLFGDEERFRVAPSHFCVHHLSFNAFKRLYDPLGTPTKASGESLMIVTEQAKPWKSMVLSRLERLPSELLRMVFAFLETNDSVALGLCSRRLWSEAIPAARESYRSWSRDYSWAGTPIICTGTYLTRLPQSIYDIDPDAEPAPSPTGMPGRVARGMPQPRRWNWVAVMDYDKVPLMEDEAHRRAFWEHVDSSGIPQDLHKHMAADFSAFAGPRFVTGSRWYLRNHTAKEYIRMELVDAETSGGEVTVAVTGQPWLTLDVLLMWLIGWSGGHTRSWDDDLEIENREPNQDARLPSSNGLPDKEFLRVVFQRVEAGLWAGHALDVVDEKFEGVCADWFDRSVTIDKLAGRWLQSIYARSVGDPELKEYWARYLKVSD